MIWIILIAFILFIFIIFLIAKNDVSILKDRSDFTSENEYLNKFIPHYLESDRRLFFFTGPAGSGKSTFIKEFVRYTEYKEKTIKVTSTTGVSAFGFDGGETINSFSGIGIDKGVEKTEKVIRRLSEKQKNNIIETDVLVIDEISMMNSGQFDLLDNLFKKVRNSEEPFGGMEVLVFGDFLQLPPVEISKDLNKDVPWVFKSNSWKYFSLFSLNTVYRQNEKDFILNLGRIRIGSFNEKTINYFKRFKNESKDSLKIRGTNNEVDLVNKNSMQSINGKKFTFDYRGNEELSKKKESELISILEPLQIRLELKIGCRVISVINDLKNSIANGTTGTLKGIKVISNEEFLEIAWDTGNVQLVKRKTVNQASSGYSFSQFPIKLAHAVTAHKSQGMTLDLVDIDFNKFFESGQAYVALSRVRSTEGLSVKNISKKAIKINDEAFQYYNSNKEKFNTLSIGNFSVFSDKEIDGMIDSKRLYEIRTKSNSKDESWILEKLVDNDLISKNDFKHYHNQPAVCKITILNNDDTISYYIGESVNVIQRIAFHYSNAFELNHKSNRIQNVTKKIKSAKKYRFEFLTQKEWFIGKYITKEDWDNKSSLSKRILIKKILLAEESHFIMKEKEKNSKLENRTNGIH